MPSEIGAARLTRLTRGLSQLSDGLHCSLNVALLGFSYTSETANATSQTVVTIKRA
jgi:hypothetical protein